MTIRNAFPLALLATGLLFTPPTAAEPALDAPAHPGPIAAFPWLHRGLRLSYRVTDTLDRGNLSAVTQNDDGTWTLDATHGGAGVAIAQFTIAGLNDQKVATTLESYLVDLVSGKMTWQSVTGSVADTHNDQLGAGWVAPDRLNQLLKNPPEHTRASRITFAVSDGKRKCDAAFFRGEENGVYVAHIYDLATGLILHEATRKHVPPTVDQRGFPIPGGTKLRLSTFLASRDVTFPWADEPPPPWVAQVTTIQFDGQSVLHALTPGAPEIPTPMRTTGKVTARPQPGWLAVHQRIQLGNAPPTESDTVWTGFSFGDGWIGPASLRRLHAGDALDKDPVTGVALTVSRADADGVTLTQTNGSSEQSCRYDAKTGMLNAFRATMPSLHSEVQMRLTGTQ